MSEARRVVMTGVGAVTPLGHSCRAARSALDAGLCAVGRPTLMGADGGVDSWRGAQVRDFDPRPFFSRPKAIKLTQRATQFAVAAAAMALASAGSDGKPEAEDLGVLIGTSAFEFLPGDLARAIGPDPGGLASSDTRFFASRILGGLNPMWLLMTLPNMTSAHVAIQVGARGPNSTVMTDAIAGIQAVGEAAEWVACGETARVLAGGAESPIQPCVYMDFEQGGLIDAGDPDADLVPGEGAAIFVLEEREAVRRRGGVILGEIAGYATASGSLDAGASGPESGALARTMRGALEAAGWTPDDLTHLAPGAIPGRRHRQAEARAFQSVLGSRAGELPRVDFGSQIGYAFAAASPIQLALILDTCREAGPARVLFTGLGYSGQAASLAVEVEGGRT